MDAFQLHRRTRLSAAVLSLAAATMHIVVMGEHADEWWGYALFFLFAAGCQGMFAMVVLGQPWMHDRVTGGPWPTAKSFARNFYFLGVGGNAALIGMYLVTRTVGVPWFGPAAGEAEPWSPQGVITKLLEVILVGLLVWLVRHPLTPNIDGGRLLRAATHDEDQPHGGEPQER